MNMIFLFWAKVHL